MRGAPALLLPFPSRGPRLPKLIQGRRAPNPHPISQVPGSHWGPGLPPPSGGHRPEFLLTQSQRVMEKRQLGLGGGGEWCSHARPYHFAQEDGAAAGQDTGEAHHLSPEVLDVQVVLQDHT